MQPSIYVGIVILKRVIECINSIKVLALLGMYRDASILLLNLIEVGSNSMPSEGKIYLCSGDIT